MIQFINAVAFGFAIGDVLSCYVLDTHLTWGGGFLLLCLGVFALTFNEGFPFFRG